MSNSDDLIKDLIKLLRLRLKRLPTENEVIAFIDGTDEEQNAIWNLNKSSEGDRDG